MRRVPLLVPTLIVLGLLGAWAGTSAGQLPPPPTVSLPTVTVPPAPPLPTVTTPVPTPPAPAPPTLPAAPQPPPVDVPSTPVTTSAHVPEPTATTTAVAATPTREGSGASSRFLRIADSPWAPPRPAPRAGRRSGPVAPRATTSTVARIPTTARVSTASQKRAQPEAHSSAGTTLETLRSAAAAVPPALFILALLAVALLFVAAMPQPLRASWAGAALVHHRGTITIAGVGVLAVAVLSTALLL